LDSNPYKSFAGKLIIFLNYYYSPAGLLFF